MSYEPTFTNDMFGGVHHVYQFANGYEASVICHKYSRGYEDGLWELAVRHGGNIVYDTPITSDVIGYLTDEEVQALLADIDALPAREAA